MIDKLDRLVEDTMSLNSKLVLLIGSPRSGKSDLLARLSERRKAVPYFGETTPGVRVAQFTDGRGAPGGTGGLTKANRLR